MTETAAPAMTTTVVDGVTKYTISYPLTGEDGQPILDRNQKPRFTNLVADTIEELVQKQAAQNIEVARALERSSKRFETLNRRPTTKVAAAEIKATPLTPEEEIQVGLDSQDPRKAASAIKRVVQSVVPVAEITTEVQRQAKTLDLQARFDIVRQFVKNNKDYLPIEANNALLNRYLIQNDLEFTVANLEYAAAALAPNLVARPAAPPNNAPPNNAPPENEPPNRGNRPAQPGTAPVSGLSNSQASGRSVGTTLPYTRDQLLRMAAAQDPRYDELIKNPRTNAMVNQVLAGR